MTALSGKFRSRAPHERRLLLKALLLVPLVRVGLGRMPFPTLHRLVVGRCMRRDSVLDARALTDAVVWAVDTVSRRLPGRTKCLARALAVQGLLARAGCATRLRVGVIRGPQGELEAHAWVEDHGRLLIGGSRAHIEQFTPLAVFDVDGSDAALSSAPIPTLPGAR